MTRHAQMQQVEDCCYGFIFNESRYCAAEQAWVRYVQRPFRGSWIWLWGGADAELLELVCGFDNQLAQALPFSHMQRDITPEEFLAFAEKPTSEDLEAVRLSPKICSGLGAPFLALPAINVGAMLRFNFRGTVRGIVLVGSQVP